MHDKHHERLAYLVECINTYDELTKIAQAELRGDRIVVRVLTTDHQARSFLREYLDACHLSVMPQSNGNTWRVRSRDYQNRDYSVRVWEA